MEAIILAGGKAERLGDATGGRPKALVPIAGRPQLVDLVPGQRRAGVERVIIVESFAGRLGGELLAAEARFDWRCSTR